MRGDGLEQLGPGVRVTVGKDARLSIGDGTYVTCDSLVIAATSIRIGAGCAISWGVQILDTSFHKMSSALAGSGIPARVIRTDVDWS
jgi:acetyltransferase-like isoleucine patch superfamily enzyme